MLLVNFYKRPRLRLVRGHEFNMDDRPKFYALQLFFVSFSWIDKSSTIQRVFNSAYHSQHIFSWDKKFHALLHLETEKKVEEIIKSKDRDYERNEALIFELRKEIEALKSKQDKVGIASRAIHRFYEENKDKLL
jgi:hypothetical protein